MDESKDVKGQAGEKKEDDALLSRRSGRKVTLNPKGAAYQLETKEKSYSVLLKDLRKTGVELLESDVTDIRADEVLLKTVKKKVSQWLHDYVTFMQTAIDLQALLPVDRKDEHLSRHAEMTEELNRMKKDVDTLQKELTSTEHEKSEGSRTSLTSSSAMRANLMMLRLQDERKKAEVKAQMMAVKKRQQLLKERQDLELKEKELELQVQLDIQSAQEEVNEKFEQELLNEEMPDDHQKDTQVKPSVKVQGKNSDGTAEAEGILTGLAHIISRAQNQLPVLEPEVFKGDVEQFAMWLKSFECYIESRTTESTERLHYLATYTGGSAKRAIQGLLRLRSEDAYSKAKQKLIERYGNNFVTANAYRQRLHSWPQVRPGDGKALRELSDFLEGCLVATQTVPGLNNLGNTDDITLLLKRLPRYLVDRWRRIVDKHIYERDKSEYPDMELFVTFLTKEARVACGPVSLETDQDKARKTKDRAGAFASSTGAVAERKSDRNFKRADSNYQATNSGLAAPDNYRWKCVLCMERHPLDSCDVFAKMPLAEKHAVIRKHGVCRGCLRIGHIWKECKRRRECGKCHGAHPTLLHDDDFRSPRGTHGRSVSVETQTATTLKTEIRSPPSDADNKTPCFHSLIVPVMVHHRSAPEHKEIVYAILDPQSDGTFITESICDQIKAPGVETTLELSTITGRTEVKAKAVTGLVIEALDASNEISLPTTYTREDMPVDRQLIPRRETAAKWPHLREVTECIPPYYPDASIGLLIGLNCSQAIKPKELVTGDDNAPWAVRTALGWGVVGLALGNKACCLTTCEGTASRPCHFTLRTRAREVGPTKLIEMLEAGFQDQLQEKKVSQQDKKFVELMDTQMHVTEDGHMEAPLPLKDPDVVMPNNKKLAMQRLQGLKRRFEKDQKFEAEYNTFITEMLQTGVAEPVPREEHGGAGSNGVWYLPHHGVRHPRKRKLRVVFDCSCEFDGRSLNSELMQGPDMANNLCGILTRFRKLPVALTCDIRGMFNQVKVNQEHRNLLRFLWWKDGNLQAEPTEFRMTTHLFGATSSPSCAMFALNKTAELYEDECGPEAAAFVRHDFYVDDGLISTPDKDSACDLAGSATTLCSKGGFQLHQFTSNEPDVIAGIPEENRSKNLQNKDVVDEYTPVEQALGLSWNIQDDTLLLTGDLPDKPVTRRGILSTVSSLYDPLGLVSPFTLQGKQILKRLCCEGGGWDEPVHEHEDCWLDWKADLATLSNLAVPRCYVPSSCLVECYELHNFSDASLEGLGACSYLRMKTTDGQLYSSLVLGKARVTPKRVATVPRLELAAALLSTKTSQFLKQELNIPNLREYFWCDSKVVLGYIRNEDKRFHVFVANRVQQIRQYTTPDQWGFVSSEVNPADYASRGQTVSDLKKNNIWWQGPEFLRKLDDERTPDTFEVPDDDPEVKRMTTLATAASVPQQFASLKERLLYFSDWFRACRAVALCIKFVRRLRHRIKSKATKPDGEKSDEGLCTEDLMNAEKLIFRQIQKEDFNEDIAALSSDEGARAGDPRRRRIAGSLRGLDPFVDQDGLLRVGGRARKSSLSMELAHPIILPKRGHITDLIVRECHERTHHSGREMTLNEVRQRGLWIVQGRSAVVRIILSCVKCKRLRGNPCTQKMGDLPTERLEAAEPFENSGVDAFGPFFIKERRSEVKRWILLFTCLSCRGIHLETVNSMTADAFLNAFRRFVCRRGPVKKLFCDNGTNFIGGKSTLEAALTEMEKGKIKRELLKDQCDFVEFSFNIPHASHMGGSWERLIRSTRTALTSILDGHSQHLDDELFRTFVTEAENVVNSRPISVCSMTNTDSVEPITPAQLLTCKSKVLLPPPGVFSREDVYARRRWRRLQHLADVFWSRWQHEYVPTMQERRRWIDKEPNMKVDDLVAVVDDSLPRSQWHLGRIVTTYPSADDLVRKVRVRIGAAEYDRPVHRLVMIMRAQNGDSRSGSL